MKIIYYVSLLIILAGTFSCNKDWLEAKPDLALVVPSTIDDYQAILDNNVNIFNINQPALGEISSGDFYISGNNWTALPTNQEKYAYTWAQDIYQGSQDKGDWNDPYKQVFNADIVLDGIAKVHPESSRILNWNNVKGSALFLRAFAFYNLLQLYAKPYDSATADVDPGIPLRLISDVNQKSVRSSIGQSYEQVIHDLLQAKPLLPIAPLYKTRPSKPAVFALLARVFLTMRDYGNALLNADSCLQIYHSLLDYNTLNLSARYPVPRLNSEVIFHSTIINYRIFGIPGFNTDSLLYQAYDTNDLRKNIYFKLANGNINYRGSYAQSRVLFGGLAVDEIYLVRAECYARKSMVAEAMRDLNTLLGSRYKTGTFLPLTASGQQDALNKILLERRKELCFRGLRWSDLRRLNNDPLFTVTLTRKINGQTFSLPPNDPRYVFPIPQEVIRLSGMPQNTR